MSASAWRAADRPAINYGTSGEQIARAAALLIATNLEAQCEIQETQWLLRDETWAQAMGRPFIPTKISRVPKERIFTGARPSLVESRFDLWPAITVRCDTRGPSDDREQPDQYDAVDVQLVVEVLTRAGPFEEDVITNRDPIDMIDRQYQRLTDAVIACIDTDRTLGNNVLPIKRPPRWVPSLPFARPLEGGAGPELLFQGVELSWTVTALMY